MKPSKLSSNFKDRSVPNEHVQSSDFNTNSANIRSNMIGTAVSFIFISGGSNIAWSFGFTPQILPEITKHMSVSWFAAAIFGAIIFCIIGSRIHKKLIVLISALLVLIAGALFTAFPEHTNALLAARYLDGLANGLVFVPTLVLLSELSHENVRGRVCSSVEALSFTEGATVQIINFALSAKYQHTTLSTQIHGLISILLGFLAFVIGGFLIFESRQRSISFNEEQTTEMESSENNEQLNTFEEEHQPYIASHNKVSLVQTMILGLPALLKLCFYRGMTALSFSALSASAFLICSTVVTDTILIWPFFVYGLIRWLSAAMTAQAMDSLGRKTPMLLGVLFCGGLAIGAGVLFRDHSHIHSSWKMFAAIYLLIAYQFFAGIAHTASSAYLGEAFPISIKPCFIAVAFIVEMMVQVVILVGDYQWQSVSYYFYAVGGLSFAFFIFGVLSMPETKRDKLSEARAKFSVCFNRTTEYSLM